MSGCPVCRAAYRGAAECPRCGADLSLLMALEVRSLRWRESARRALWAGDPAQARRLAADAQRLHCTPAGSALIQAATLLELLPEP